MTLRNWACCGGGSPRGPILKSLPSSPNKSAFCVGGSSRSRGSAGRASAGSGKRSRLPISFGSKTSLAAANTGRPGPGESVSGFPLGKEGKGTVSTLPSRRDGDGSGGGGRGGGGTDRPGEPRKGAEKFSGAAGFGDQQVTQRGQRGIPRMQQPEP